MVSYGSWGRRFFVFGKNFRKVRQNCTLSVRTRVLIQLFFLWIVWVSSLFSDCGKNFLQHWHKNLREVVKSAFYLINKAFRGKCVFWRKYLLLQIFRVLMKNSADFCRNAFSPVWKTAFYTRLGDLLSYHCHFSRENSLLQTEFVGNCLDFCDNFLTWWLKLFSLCPEDMFEETIFFFTKSSEFSVVFETLRKTFRIFGDNNIVGLSKLLSSVQGIFSDKLFFENKFFEMFLNFWSSGTNFLDFRRNFCDRFVKTAFHLSSGDFWLDCFFYKNLWVFSPSSGCEENILAFWLKNFRKFVKTAKYEYKIFLLKIWFSEEKLLHFFWVVIKKLPDFCQKKLSKRKTMSKIIFFVGKNSWFPMEVEGEGFSCSVRTFERFVKTAL